MAGEELLALAQRLGRLGDDLAWVGDLLVRKAHEADWECAKAERYRATMVSRRDEARRLANEIYFLAHWAKLQGLGQQAAGPAP